MAASVPELTKRIRSIEGMSDRTFSPSRTSASVGAPWLVPRRIRSVSVLTMPAGAWPWMSGPHDMTKSM